jgi:iron complex outermembrane recepter protein
LILRDYVNCVSGTLLVALVSGGALAQSQLPIEEEIVVIGRTPVLGLGVDQDKVPANVRVFGGDSTRRGGSSNFLRTLEEGAGGFALVHAQNNPFQPSIVYRGFEASPLNGVAQGLAVYVNGVRFNQPFGDAVSWDLLPDVAVERMNLEGTNAVFGLNALGGSLSLQMKDGFGYEGAELEMFGGMFGRVRGSIQYGASAENFAVYVGGSGLTEDGWRDHSPSDLRQIYGDVGWRGELGEVHFNFTGADNDMTGNGTAPLELLQTRRASVFTHPDNTRNKFAKFSASATYNMTEATLAQMTAYFGDFSQRTLNGDAADVEVCEDDDSNLCLEDGGVLTDASGVEISNFVTNSPFLDSVDLFDDADFDEGGPYAFVNRTSTQTDSYGFSLQLTSAREILGRKNHFVVGASFDRGQTRFRASTEIGGLTLDRGFSSPTVLIDMTGGPITPVHLKTTNTYYGLYVSNIFDLTPDLSLTVSGRYNSAKTKLRDQIGTALNGDHKYDRFNPGAGLTYKITPAATAYAHFSQANRVPTPAELSCADENAPCSLANFFVSDPPLRQVVSQSVEAGLRGAIAVDVRGRLKWNVGVFNNANANDIIFVPSDISGRAFFRNAGETRRRGLEAGLEYQTERFSAFVDYAYVEATFRSSLSINSPNHPAADGDGNIAVDGGDHLPGVAPHTVKFGAAYDIVPSWTVALDARAVSGQYLFGDESNNAAKVPGYVVVNANTTYGLTDRFEFFAMVQNLFDTKYETFGTFSETEEVPLLEVPDAENPRAFSAAPPIAIYGGVRFRF